MEEIHLSHNDIGRAGCMDPAIANTMCSDYVTHRKIFWNHLAETRVIYRTITQFDCFGIDLYDCRRCVYWVTFAQL